MSDSSDFEIDEDEHVVHSHVSQQSDGRKRGLQADGSTPGRKPPTKKRKKAIPVVSEVKEETNNDLSDGELERRAEEERERERKIAEIKAIEKEVVDELERVPYPCDWPLQENAIMRETRVATINPYGRSDRKSEFQKFLFPQLRTRFLEYQASGDYQQYPFEKCGWARQMLTYHDGFAGVLKLVWSCIQAIIAEHHTMIVLILDMTALMSRLMEIQGYDNDNATGVKCTEVFAQSLIDFAQLHSDKDIFVVLSQDNPIYNKETIDAKIVRKKRYMDSEDRHAVRNWIDPIKLNEMLEKDPSKFLKLRRTKAYKPISRPYDDVLTRYNEDDYTQMFIVQKYRAKVLSFMIQWTLVRIIAAKTPNLFVYAEYLSTKPGTADKMMGYVFNPRKGTSKIDIPTVRPMEGEFTAASAYTTLQRLFESETGGRSWDQIPHPVVYFTIDTDLLAVGLSNTLRDMCMGGKRDYLCVLWGLEYDTRVLRPAHSPQIRENHRFRDMLFFLLAYGVIANDYVFSMACLSPETFYSLLEQDDWTKFREVITKEALTSVYEGKANIRSVINKDAIIDMVKAMFIYSLDNTDLPYQLTRTRYEKIEWKEFEEKVAKNVGNDYIFRVPTPKNLNVFVNNVMYAISVWILYSRFKEGDPCIDPFKYGYTISYYWLHKRGFSELITEEEQYKYAEMGAFISPICYPNDKYGTTIENYFVKNK